MPETLVVIVGDKKHIEGVLLHPSFRNNAHVIYIALHETPTNDVVLTTSILDHQNNKYSIQRR